MINFKKEINSSIRPQDDFYKYVNDNWLNSTSIPPEESSWGSFQELIESNRQKLHEIVKSLLNQSNIQASNIEQKVRDFYLSGMNKNAEEAGLRKIRELYSLIDKCSNSTDIVKLLGKFHLLSIDALWDIYVDQDEKDSSRYVLRFHQAGLSLPNRDYYFIKSDKMKQIRSSFATHSERMFAAIDHPIPPQLGNQILNFEKILAENSMSAVELRNIEAQYNMYQYKDLLKITPNINWDSYFLELGIKPPKQIVIDQPIFFKHLNNCLPETDTQFIKNYLKWHVLRVTAGRLGERIAKANFDFYGKVLSGTETMQPQWKRVLAVIDICIGEALGKLYVDTYFPPVAKQRMEELVANLKAAFADRITNLEWMKPKTKQLALKKLEKIYVKVGYAKKLKTYQGLRINTDSYIDNYLNSKEYNARYQLQKLGKKVDREEWFMTPPTVNAYFSPNKNEIVFPAGILQPPFFDFKANDAINYGGIGSVIGHELTHGFDDQGSLYDAEGNLKNWRSKEEKKEFDKRARVMVEQADEYEVLPNEYLKGELTLGENIADLGGAETAFQAFKKLSSSPTYSTRVDEFSPEKLFFLSNALVWRKKMREERTRELLLVDPHAPGEFRINNTFRNMNSFSEVFKISTNDKMYLAPEKRIKIW